MAERWKAVVGFEGLYEVSDLGRVRSIDRRVLAKASSYRPAHWRSYKGKLLSPGAFTKQGHLSLPLGHGTHGMPVHQLVLAAFVGPCPGGQEPLHRNGVANDNRLSNLHYGTRSENNKDIVFHGRRKVSVEQIRYIRRRVAAGVTQASMAVKFELCSSQVNNIVHRRHYAHVR